MVLHLIYPSNRNLWITELAAEMRSAGSWRPIVVSLHPMGHLQEDLRALGIETASLDVRSRRAYALGLARLARLLRRHDVAVLHSHLFDANLIAAAARRLGLAKRLVITRHEPPGFVGLARISPVKRTLVSGTVQLTDATADAVIAPSALTYAELIAASVPEDRIHQIPIGLDTTKIDDVGTAAVSSVKRELGLDGPLNAVAISRLAFEKDLDVLIDAWRPVVDRYPDARLVIVGQGPLEHELRERATRLGIGVAVRFAGWRADVYAILKSADLMVHVSRTESTGMVLLEALTAGTPLVTTPVGVVGEHLLDGVHCLVVPHGDPQATSAAILRLAGDRALRERLTRDGRAIVESVFSMAAMARAYEALYDGLLSS